MGIKVLQVNIQHWDNNHYFLKCSLSNNNPDVILLNELSLKPNSIPRIIGYKCIYKCPGRFTGVAIFSDPRRGCYMGLSKFIFFLFSFFSFFPATILSGPYLWNRYSQRLQIECAAWSCGLIFHCCLPSNSLRYFFFFFTPRFCPGHISGTVTRRDSKLSVLLGLAV